MSRRWMPAAAVAVVLVGWLAAALPAGASGPGASPAPVGGADPAAWAGQEERLIPGSLLRLGRPLPHPPRPGSPAGSAARPLATGAPFGLALSDSVADRGPLQLPAASPLAGRHVYRDGGQTVALSDGRTLWIFADTQLDGANGLAVRNSAALADGARPHVVADPMPGGSLVPLVEVVHDDPDIPDAADPVAADPDCPTAKDGVPYNSHAAWPSGGVAVANGDGTDTVLVYYLNACIYLSATDFAYEQLSMGVATLHYDPADHPDLTQPSALPALQAAVVDNSLFVAPHLYGGSPVLADGFVHLYDCSGDLFGAECRAARAPATDATDAAAFRFWDGAAWAATAASGAVPLAFGAGGVPFGGMQIVATPDRPPTAGPLPDPARFVMAYVLVPDQKLSFRTAPAPEGPWSDVHQADLGPCGTTFATGCYAITPQPSLSSPGTLGVSFVSQVDLAMHVASVPYRRADAVQPLTAPARVLDTRDGTGRGGLVAPLAADATATVPIAGRTIAGQVVPASASAAVVNLTVVGKAAGTHLLAGPTGGPLPTGSIANTPAGRTRANTTIVALGPTGSFDVTNGPGAADVVVDVLGWVGPSAPAHVVTSPQPARILDTRDGTGLAGPGPLGAGEVIERIAAGETLSGVAIPAGATGLLVNVTAVGPSAATHLTVYPAGPLPPTSTVNVEAGLTRANFAVVALGAGGAYGLRNNSGSVHVVVDLMGWLVPAGTDPAGVRALAVQSPARAVDTRTGAGTGGGGHPGPAQKLGPGQTVTFTGAATGGTIAGTGGVIVSLTGELPTAATHLTVGSVPSALPTTSSVNLPVGETVANLVVVVPGPDGTYAIRNNSGSLHLIVDVVGWLAPPG